jgi:aconitate hydratase
MVDPRESGFSVEAFEEPSEYLINRTFIIPPREDTSGVRVIKGPNIKEVSIKEPLKDRIEAAVLLKLGDNITTDDIMPAGSAVLPFRSNIPAISEFVFRNIDPTFSGRAREAKTKGGGIIIGGENYGQGSSREHAAIAPMFLGIQAVIAKSFARIHRSNLINFGIMPLIFDDPNDYDRVSRTDRLVVPQVSSSLDDDQKYFVENQTQGITFVVKSNLNEREKEIIKSGGLLPYTKERAART